MISRKLAGISAASVGAATAVTALLLGTVSGNAAEEFNDSAYGIASEGLVPIAPTPSVKSTDGQVVKDSLLQLPPPLGVGVLEVEAGGNAASAKAVRVNIAELVKADVLHARCDNGEGAVEIIGGSAGGQGLPAGPAPGQGIDLSPIAKIDLNKQTENEDGTLTVEALVVTVLPTAPPQLPIAPQDLDRLSALAPELALPAPDAAPTVGALREQLQQLNPGLLQDGALLKVTISSATCGAAKKEEPEAPKPEPIETQLPVTH
ncbi:MAG: choice-of-anchor P family protein [Pseudonocardiaceae bacterium]